MAYRTHPERAEMHAVSLEDLLVPMLEFDPSSKIDHDLQDCTEGAAFVDEVQMVRVREENIIAQCAKDIKGNLTMKLTLGLVWSDTAAL